MESEVDKVIKDLKEYINEQSDSREVSEFLESIVQRLEKSK